MAQSGILPNDATLSAFNTYLQSPKTPLVISINGNLQLVAEQLPLADIPPSNAHYIVTPSQDKHVFVSYIPDTIAVREKMLYASTRNALLKGLGTDHFSQILFSNDEDDLKNWEKFTAPPIVEEVTPPPVVVETTPSRPSAKLVADINSKLLFNIPDDVREVLLDNSDKHNLLQHITFINETVHLQSHNTNGESIQSLLSTTTPSYYIYKTNASAYFILACPSGSSIRQRMFLAANKNAFVNYLSDLGYKFTKNIEIGDPDELVLEDNDNDETQDTLSRQPLRFAKPRGPKRR